jgi:hypothetical protein
MKISKQGKILVTGASGFIGGRVAEYLFNKGFMIRAQYRREKPPEHLKELNQAGVELVRADLTQTNQIKTVLPDISGIIHAAAIAFDWGPKKLFQDINYHATVQLLDEAKKQGVDTFLFISSLSVHGFGPHKNSTEDGPYYPYDSEYQRSKKAAEDYVIESNGDAIRTVVIRPGNVYGPGDTTTFYPLFEAIEAGKIPLAGGGSALTCPVHILDLVDAVYKAFISNCSGEIFNITAGEDIRWKEVFTLSAAALGAAAPRVKIPAWIALFTSWFVEGLSTLIPFLPTPAVTRYRVKQVIHDYHFDISKAKQILGFTPKISFRDGVEETAAAYKEWKQDC